VTLLVSIGNTRTVCAMLGDDGRLSAVRRLPTPGLAPGAFDPGPGPVHVVSVVRDAADRLVSGLRRAGARVTWWAVDRGIPVAHPYAPPEQPGADRLVAALAAHRRAAGRCIVVDAGTAVTVDLVDEDGALLGGAIAPGFRALAEGLAARAPALPVADREASPAYPARSTVDAVNLGVHAAFEGLLRVLVLQGTARAGSVPILVTGGDADLAANAIPDLHPILVQDLVLEGLAILARS
jgi:pantothenate kinase type III